MSKKNRKSKAKTETPAETAPVQETTVPETVTPAETETSAETEAASETTDAPATETPAETTDAPVTETPAPEATAAAPVYWVNPDREFKPRRGFEQVLYAALQEQRTEAEVVKHLLESGEYARVAPKAAEVRPAKPVKYLLKIWTIGRVLKTSVAA